MDVTSNAGTDLHPTSVLEDLQKNVMVRLAIKPLGNWCRCRTRRRIYRQATVVLESAPSAQGLLTLNVPVRLANGGSHKVLRTDV